MKEELNAKLAEFASTVDNLEEIFENREQIEISRFYDEEFLNDQLIWREKEEEEEEAGQ